jgi:GNAT superfamily N-acetyltransferase
MVSRDGLVLELLFDDGARDTSGSGCDGVVHGAVPTTDRFGREAAAYRFDGADDYVVVAPPPRFSDAQLTVSVWACFDPADSDLSGWRSCIVCQDNGDDRDQSRRVFQLSAFQGRVVWHRMMGACDPTSRKLVRLGKWQHVVAVVDRLKQRLYIDGVLHDSVRHSLRAHIDEPIYIGRKGTPEPYFFFHGAIDDLRIYNRSLSAAEIGELFHEGGFGQHDTTRGSDPISGTWAVEGGGCIDLTFDGQLAVSGTATAGRPGNLAVIKSGTFDRQSRLLKLTGDAKRPDTGEMVQLSIEGTLARGRLAVTYQIGADRGRAMLRRVTAWSRLRKRVKARLGEALRRLEPALVPVVRYLRARQRPSKATNLRRLRERDETLTSLAFRDAVPEDIPALAQLHAKTWAATYPNVRRPPTAELRASQWREAFAKAERDWFCIVIENRNHELIGFAKGIQHSDLSGDLNKIYLLSEYQRMGIGRRLVGHVARRFLSQGVSRMTLFADAANPSCWFYLALGATNPRNDRGGVDRGTFVWSDLGKLAVICPVESDT